MKHSKVRTIWQSLIIMMFVLIGAASAVNAATVLSSDRESVSGCTTLGIDGKYVSQAAAAVARINAIRLEACKQGVLNPATGKKLTTSDYVPVQWSSDMEYIARIRAAEASLTLDHVRTDDTSCFNIKSPNGQLSYSEVLAWNWDETMLSAIDLWYAEKAEYIATNGNGASYSIGHYASMINPKYKYVGLATFCSTGAAYYNTTCGEFSKNAGSSTTPMASYSSCTQLLNIKNEYITSNANGVAVVNIDGSNSINLSVVSTAAVKSAVREVSSSTNESNTSKTAATASSSASSSTTAETSAALPESWSSSDATFQLKEDHAVYYRYIGKGGSAVIPDSVTVNGTTLKVTEIAASAFNNAAGKKVTSLQIGKNVTTIGKNAFKNCKKLKKIKIQSKQIKKIGSGAFKGVSKKAKLTVPGSVKKAYKKLAKKAGFKGTVK